MQTFCVLKHRKMSFTDSVACGIFMYSIYSVISVLKAFQAAIVLSSQYTVS